jgi:trehalose 6-phosphate phosphatase
MAEELRDVAPLLPLLEERPFTLLSDIDGTLAPIVSNPEDARVTARAENALRELVEAGVLVALVTGRSLEVARGMVDVPGAYFAANHGLDIFADGLVETPDEVRPYVAWAREVLRDTRTIEAPGVVIEDKGPVVAFHYRMAASEDDARAAIRLAIAGSEAASRFRVQEGRKVIELRPPLDIDKGTAARALVARMGARSVLAMGDDATDVDLFRAVREMDVRSAIVAVRNEEATPEVLANADYFVEGVAGVEWLLGELVRVKGEG